jgi:hypothetical protein
VFIEFICQLLLKKMINLPTVEGVHFKKPSAGSPERHHRPRKPADQAKKLFGNFFPRISIVQSGTDRNISQQQYRPKTSRRSSHQSEHFHQVRRGPELEGDERSNTPQSIDVIDKDFYARVQSLQIPSRRDISYVGILKTAGKILTASINHASCLQSHWEPSASLFKLLDPAWLG